MKRAWPLLMAACATSQLPPVKTTQRSELALRCTPGDADVVLDGVPQGTCADFTGSPKALAMGHGTRRVVVKKSGFETWERWMDADRTRVVMDVTLVPNGGSAQ